MKRTSKKEQPLVAYKAFNDDLSCKGFKYEVGKTYELPKGETARLCSSGFHACLVPFDCWRYYQGSKTFGRVSLGEVSKQRENDSKVVAARITIEATLDLSQWIKSQVEAVLALCKTAKKAIATKEETNAAATGDSGHAAATGDSGHAAATGYSGHAAATGDSGHAAATGYSGHAAATGDSGHAAATGKFGHAAATGKFGQAACLGFSGQAKAGESGTVLVTWWDAKAERPRVAVGYVGEDGIKADTYYKADSAGKLVLS